MAESAATTAATAIFGRHHLGQPPESYRLRSSQPCRLFFPRFTGRRRTISIVKSLAMEITKEAPHPSEGKMPHGLEHLWPPPNRADKPSLHNPRLRQERMGCGWLSVIFELDGVIVDDDPELERQAWLVLSQEEGKSPPLAFILRRIEGMKNEQAIAEVLCWSREPSELRRLAARKEEIHRSLRGGFYSIRPGSLEFLNTLTGHNIPMAVASTRPRKSLEEAIESAGVRNSVGVIVAAEDVYRGKPDPEMFIYAAQQLDFIPERCIVFGNSNSTVEAAHDARMKCVAVASKHPIYELSAADLVVRHLDELSVVDLKNLADIDSHEFGMAELEMELEEEEVRSSPSTATDDMFW